MPAPIVCAIDAGPGAGNVVRLAAQMSACLKAPLVVVTVDRLRLGVQGAIHDHDPQAASAVLDRGRAEAEAAGATGVEYVILQDDSVSHAILTHAREVGAAHILVGTGEKGLLQRATIGSVSQAIVVGATCSVTVVR